MIELRIDPEFRDKIPPMPKEDFEGLREDILRDGYIRDPLVVWEEENILLDGHHRWRVIQEFPDVLGDKFTVDYKSFPDRWACIAWICANQLHKHNMNDFQRDKLIQQEYEARQKTNGGDRRSESYQKSVGEIVQLKNSVRMTTRPAIAKEHGISEGAVKIAVEVGRGIDRAAEVDPEFKQEVLSGEIKASKKDIAEIRKMESDEEVKAAIEEIRNPKPKREKNPNIEPLHEPKRNRMTAEDREIAERVRQNIENENQEFVYTIESLIDEVRKNANDYISSLKNTFVVRSTLLVGENRARAAESVDYIIKEITKIKELLA